MSEVVTGAVKLTFGFLANKIRSGVAERLKDSDVTDEECRRLIVRELDDVKSKLDGLARKDLLPNSICFLQDGVNRLYQSLLQLDLNENAEESTKQATLVEAAPSRDTGPDSPINEAVALTNAMTSLKIRSNDRYKSAIKSFKLADEKATEAFCNEALSIEDRIQASQIRMMARIWESLEDPDASVSDCLQYLQQLHDIGAIQQMFSVLNDGGMKSLLNKTKRLNNVSSVQVMNQILFEFAKKFTKSSLFAWLSHWPAISLGEKSYQPVFGDKRVFKKLKESGLQVMLPYEDVRFGDVRIDCSRSVVNSTGEIVAKIFMKDSFKIFKRSGESRTLCEVPREEHVSECEVRAMGVDADDNIYVITAFQGSDDQPWSFKLFIFDKNGNKKLESPLPIQQSFVPLDSTTMLSCLHNFPDIVIAINKDGKIAILNCRTKILYIGNVSVEMNSFKVDKTLSLTTELSIDVVQFSDFNGTKIIAADTYSYHFNIYTENGELQQEIKIPEEHGWIKAVAVNHVTKRIFVKTYHPQGCRLLKFSETGELLDRVCLGSSWWIYYARLTSHPNGPVVLVSTTGAVLLQQ